MRHASGTTRRLIVAFTSLVVLFGMTSLVTLRGLHDIHDGLHQVQHYTTGVRLSLELASAVRDQYAHQAHTIIIGDTSHLGFYEDAKSHVLELTQQVKRHAEQPDEMEWVEDIERASEELDIIFQVWIVPAVLKRDAVFVQEQHDRAQLVVSHIQERADQLVQRFESLIERFQARVDAVQHTAERWTLMLLILSPLMAIAIGLYIGRSVAAPVAKLQAGAARLAQGHMDTRIDVETADEFGDLARQFNTMTNALREQQEKLVQSEKLAGIGRLAAGVAHEINNPLGVMLGYTRLLQRKAEGEQAEDLRVIEEEALRCQSIVEGLLDLSRPFRPLVEPVDLKALCHEVAERITGIAGLQGVRITVDGMGTTTGHPQKLRQVLFNLIKNAAEAAAPDGRVTIHITGNHHDARVQIEDSGPGIDPRAQDQLFEPFCTTKPSGTGLGLAVSRAIARAHGGEIEVGESQLGGAMFALRLPVVGQRSA